MPDESRTNILIYELDTETFERNDIEPLRTYSNAKIVLVGESGVGKSGLALVLCDNPYSATDSTHGRKVFLLDSRNVKVGTQHQTREILLWDLAGQPGYRLIHQLSLNDVSLALVVFDSRNETDAQGGIQHWCRSLEQVHRAQGASAFEVKKLLVAARVDRGGTALSPSTIQEIVKRYGFLQYFETSAKEGWQIEGLKRALLNGIDWETIPTISSTDLFERIKGFLLREQASGTLLSTIFDLFQRYRHESAIHADTRAEFDNSVRLIESRGLVRSLSFGGLILLQPELIDAYAASILEAARSEPGGLGSIRLQMALTLNFRMPQSERVQDRETEKLLAHATVEDLLRFEIALRETIDDEIYLIFPSQLTRDWPLAPDPPGKAVVFDFQGDWRNIYATLVVRLSQSGLFIRDEMWRNAVLFSAKAGASCGIFLKVLDDGAAEMSVFFEGNPSEETKFQFEEYVRTHLERRCGSARLHRVRIYTCAECGAVMEPSHVDSRRQRSMKTMKCPVCDAEISLLDREERLREKAIQFVAVMDRSADAARDKGAADTVIEVKEHIDQFDVFLSYNRADLDGARLLYRELLERGIRPWFDHRHLRPGLAWEREIEDVLSKVRSAAVLIGQNGLGQSQEDEMRALLRLRSIPVIPVILNGVKNIPALPAFLQGRTWVDLRQQYPPPMEQLIFGITGWRPVAAA